MEAMRGVVVSYPENNGTRMYQRNLMMRRLLASSLCKLRRVIIVLFVCGPALPPS
jgi:hypothetical protein